MCGLQKAISGQNSSIKLNPPFALFTPRVWTETERQYMQIKKNLKLGFTRVEIMIVVAIIGLLAAIAIPNFVKARTTAQANACINNLRQIDSAKQQWALEQRVGTNTTPGVTDIDPYLGRSGNSSNVTCPAGGQTATFLNSYTINPESQPPACEIGAGFAPPH